MQNQLSAGSTVVEPTKKAKASVAEVINTEMPPVRAVLAMSSGTLRLPPFSLASLEWVKNSEVNTKASSTPRPSSRKYRLLFKLPLGTWK